MTAAGAIGAPIGRLGVEDDHYVEANLIHKRFADDGSSALFRIMLADSTETNNEWTASESQLNVRQVYAELNKLSMFSESSAFADATFWQVNDLTVITLTFTSLTRISFSYLVLVLACMTSK